LAAILAASAAGSFAGPTSGGPGPAFVPAGSSDESRAGDFLARCRQAGIPGDYYYEFQLQVLPRRGPERVIPGRLWGSHNEDGIVWRIVLDPGGPNESHWLVQGGRRPAVWKSAGSDGPQPVGPFAPLVEGGNLTPFDLQYPPPYLYWSDARLLGTGRILGRPTHVFLFRPSAVFGAQHPDMTGVESDLDAEFDVPVRTQILGPGDVATKTLSLVDLKKVKGQWILKEVDARDEQTRNKIRFDVTAAAVGVEFSPSLFEPAALADRVDPPSADLVTQFGP
jgi:hypothetical protein